MSVFICKCTIGFGFMQYKWELPFYMLPFSCVLSGGSCNVSLAVEIKKFIPYYDSFSVAWEI